MTTGSQVNPSIDDSWKAVLKDEFSAPYFTELKKFLTEEKKKHVVYPPGNQIFAAFNDTPFDKVKVVIIGQDPYHGQGQANGLSFSVSPGIVAPPSLKNIFKELHTDLGIPVPYTGNLEPWAKQGVLLLNATLTVRANTAGSHQKKGWEQFTDAVIHLVADRLEHVVFILWGNYAISKGEFIDARKHLVLKSVHPSPLSASRGFFGNQQFSTTNTYLMEWGKEPVKW